jgi:peptidoglycan/xylan/chitin deacetylase (PgdA/CDA1 family)
MPRAHVTPRCAVSVDVDGLACYYRIHGLGPAPRELRDLMIRRALPRFAEILGRWGMAATFFVVGRDVDPAAWDAGEPGNDVAASRAVIARLAARGHEIGNHSYSHPYELARLPAQRVASEIERAHQILGALAGKPITGFRAPGYDLSPAMLRQLVRLGYAYDSSLFPAPGYYAAKAVVMAALAATGRPSGAVLTNPRALLAPATPYRPDLGAPWRRGSAPVVELPIAVTPRGRVPAIGTSLLLAPDWLRGRMLAAMRRLPLFNFELHAIDLVDAREDRIPAALVARQPDLRVPLARKQDRLESMLAQIGEQFEVCTLGQAATAFAATV